MVLTCASAFAFIVKPASSFALEAAFSIACSRPFAPELKGWTSPFSRKDLGGPHQMSWISDSSNPSLSCQPHPLQISDNSNPSLFHLIKWDEVWIFGPFLQGAAKQPCWEASDSPIAEVFITVQWLEVLRVFARKWQLEKFCYMEKQKMNIEKLSIVLES